MHLICPTAPAKYFSQRGWTGFWRGRLTGKSVVGPHGGVRSAFRLEPIPTFVIPSKAGIQYTAASRLIISVSETLDQAQAARH
jgi:hypothetical protein